MRRSKGRCYNEEYKLKHDDLMTFRNGKPGEKNFPVIQCCPTDESTQPPNLDILIRLTVDTGGEHCSPLSSMRRQSSFTPGHVVLKIQSALNMVILVIRAPRITVPSSAKPGSHCFPRVNSCNPTTSPWGRCSSTTPIDRWGNWGRSA